ncbi:DUF817 domain-containing protein [Jeotgalibacillus salarius]|uniref:DUF817 domain-containing protein n=1 Tax=Jeotgalibacillus salarius TaxID=546023 RepID=A0A4Y8LML8_9BACL|nr:DUF817 domain-containing protein [Jeotgalibacillus salarius]TFE03840.1 DUF817 domain-containing protein [Jeotgalibacillus salarius]
MFPVYIFLCLGLTQTLDLPFFARYDWLLFLCLLMQVLMVRFGVESLDELKVITVFHLIGLVMEIFKVNMGSWSYPEEAFFKVYGVPLFSGFMYASVASYLCQFWRRFDVVLIKWPSLLLAVPLAGAIYLNFFTHHYMMDFRWVLFVLVALTFYQAQLTFKVNRLYFKIPILMFFLLIGFLIWIGENIATFLGAWQYPNQHEAWELVHVGKISSWLLLMIVSFLIVANLKVVKSNLC